MKIGDMKIWFVTSSGLGKAIAQKVIDNGDFVIGTFRSQVQADSFNNRHDGKAIALASDFTKPVDTEQAFKLVTDKFSKIDMLVNNAGIGLAGDIEETTVQKDITDFKSIAESVVF